MQPLYRLLHAISTISAIARNIHKCNFLAYAQGCKMISPLLEGHPDLGDALASYGFFGF
jgi:hypothetical protein